MFSINEDVIFISILGTIFCFSYYLLNVASKKTIDNKIIFDDFVKSLISEVHLNNITLNINSINKNTRSRNSLVGELCKSLNFKFSKKNVFSIRNYYKNNFDKIINHIELYDQKKLSENSHDHTSLRFVDENLPLSSFSSESIAKCTNTSKLNVDEANSLKESDVNSNLLSPVTLKSKKCANRELNYCKSNCNSCDHLSNISQYILSISSDINSIKTIYEKSHTDKNVIECNSQMKQIQSTGQKESDSVLFDMKNSEYITKNDQNEVVSTVNEENKTNIDEFVEEIKRNDFKQSVKENIVQQTSSGLTAVKNRAQTNFSEPFYFTIPFNDVQCFLEKSGKFNKKYSCYIKDNLLSAIDRYNEIVASKESIDHFNINTCGNTVFGFKDQNFSQIIKKCDIEIKDISYLKKQFAKIRAYCCRNKKSEKNCLVYNIVVPKKPCFGEAMQCFFTTSGIFNHTYYQTSQVRGFRRERFREHMKKNLPKQARNEFVNKLSNEDISDFNIMDVKSEEVYRKIRSESINSTDHSKDDMEDLRLRFEADKNNSDRFFQYLIEPCEVGLFSKSQINVARIAKKSEKNGLIGYLDATGSIVRQILGVKTLIFYYALVIRNSRGKTFPIAERIASSHDAGSIGIWLMKFSQLCERQSTWPLFTTIVTDFSRALINGAMLQWNKCDLVTYINFCYHKIKKNENVITEKIVFKLCFAHFKKNVTRQIDSLKIDPNSKFELKRMFNYAFYTKDYNSLKYWFKHLVIVLCSKSINDDVRESLKELNEMSKQALIEKKKHEIFRKDAKRSCSNYYDTEFENLSNDEVELEDNFNDYTFLSQDTEDRNKDNDKSSYKKSYFYQDFLEIYSNFTHNNSETILNNNLFSQNFILYALQHYMPYVPMWSSIVSDGITKAYIPTNGTVEGWFREVKHNIISKVDFGAGRLKYGRFIEAVRESIRSETKQVVNKIPSGNLNFLKINKENQSEIDINSLQHKETWGHIEVLSPRTSSFANLRQSSFKTNLSTSSKGKNSHSDLSSNSNKSSVKTSISNLPATEAKSFALFEISPKSDGSSIKTNATAPTTPTHTSLKRRILSPILEEISPLKSIENFCSPIKKPKVENIEISSDSDQNISTEYFRAAKLNKKDKPAMYNNLVISDISYYRELLPRSPKTNPINYLVAKRNEVFIKYSDFKSLNNERCSKWLTEDTITYLLDVYLKNSDTIGYLDAGVGCNSVTFLTPFFFDRELKDTTIMPVNVSEDHWCLALIHKKTSILEFYDPQQFRTGGMFFEQFKKKFIASYNKFAEDFSFELLRGGEHWVLKTVKCHVRQSDGWSCGYMILNYVEHFMKDSNVNIKLFEPLKYRANLAKLVLEFSECLNEYCIFCSRNFENRKSIIKKNIIVKCAKCEKRMHESCLKPYHKQLRIKYIPNNYICLLCCDA